MKTSSKMALAGAKNDTKTYKKNTPKITTHIGSKKTQKITPKRCPKWASLGPQGRPQDRQGLAREPQEDLQEQEWAPDVPRGPKMGPKRLQNVPKMDPKSIPMKAPWGNSRRQAAAANGQSGNSKLLNGSAECAERSNNLTWTSEVSKPTFTIPLANMLTSATIER